MSAILRGAARFSDVGRILIEGLCAFPGVLDDVSAGGFKAHYLFPVEVDFECDYEAGITFARAAAEGSFCVLCHPQWAKSEGGATEIGFKILPSKDSARFCQYVARLGEDNKDDSVADEISDSPSVLIKQL
ncbi:MAG: hypothetical protein ACTTKL_03645 [Treponema sp.]